MTNADRIAELEAALADCAMYIAQACDARKLDPMSCARLLARARALVRLRAHDAPLAARGLPRAVAGSPPAVAGSPRAVGEQAELVGID
jgi:hypothetical protein